MTNKYILSHPVFSPHDAKIFSKENTWKILDILQEAGSKGLTEKEIQEKLESDENISISRGSTYNILDRLYEFEWIRRYYDTDVEARRYCFEIKRDIVDIDKDFDKIIVESQEKYIEKNLFPIFESLFKKALDDLMNNEDYKNWLPQDGEKAYCKRHRKSHEAEEFFGSILEIAISAYLDSKQFNQFLVKNMFAEEGSKSRR